MFKRLCPFTYLFIPFTFIIFLYSCNNNDSISVEDTSSGQDIILKDTLIDILSDTKITDVITELDVETDSGFCNLNCGKNMHCENEKCICNQGFEDCNKDLSDGCEADLMNETKNCGSCTLDCSHPMLGVEEFECIKGICKIKRCEEKRADCNEKENDGCEANLMTDVKNCNVCGLNCGEASYCEKGECKCKEGFANCNLSISDGCEVNVLTNNDNCGGCGNKCGVNAYCSKGKCTCNYGYENCDNKWLNGCETYILEDKYHCGSCSTDCTQLDNVLSVTCADFLCSILKCKTNFGDCNNDFIDGCESNFLTDPRYCGNCVRDCGDNSACNNGTCACKVGFGNCNILWDDGCEIDFNDTKSCGKDCSSIINCGQNTECKNYTCTCLSPFLNCNNKWDDGCEINSSNDRFNCGGCNSTCIKGNYYSGTCINSKCAGTHSFSKAYGSNGEDSGTIIAKDPQGNTIIAGIFRGSIKIGSFNLTSFGSTDIFIAKLDHDDNSVLIAKSFGSTGNDYIRDMALNQNGDIIITGFYEADINFGGGIVKNYGGKDAFLVKLNNNLEHIWSKGFGSIGDQIGNTIAVDNNLNIFVAGEFENTINLGGPENLNSYGLTDIFLSRFDNSGTHLWSRAYGSQEVATNGYDQPTSLAVDREGFIYMTGSFNLNINFASNKLISKGSYDIFLVKIDKDGYVHRTLSVGSTEIDIGLSVRVNSKRQVVLSSIFSNHIAIATRTFNTKGKMDILLLKYDSDLQYIDGTSFGSDVDDASVIALDRDDNVILTGFSKGTIKFGEEPLTNRGDKDIILVKLKPDFTHIFSYTFGSTGYDVGNWATTDSSGNIWLTGEISGAVDFGGGDVTYTAGNQLDIFVARFLP